MGLHHRMVLGTVEGSEVRVFSCRDIQIPHLPQLLFLPLSQGWEPLVGPPDSLCPHPGGTYSFFAITGGETEGPEQ